MSSTTTESVQQRGPVTKKAELEDALMNKIIVHCRQLTLDRDFKNASATYSQVKEQQEQIRTRDEKLTRLQKDIEAQKERESIVIGRFSAANQDLAIQKEIAEKGVVSLQKENTEKDKSLAEISRRIQELQRQLQTLLSERSQDERKISAMIAQHNLEIDSFQTKLKERDASIDKLKESNAKLTRLLSDENAKRGYLEKDKKSLEEKMLKAHSQLEKFDSFILKHHQIDEQSMLVIPPNQTLQVIDIRAQNRWLFEPLGLCGERNLDHFAAGSERRESQSRFSCIYSMTSTAKPKPKLTFSGRTTDPGTSSDKILRLRFEMELSRDSVFPCVLRIPMPLRECV